MIGKKIKELSKHTTSYTKKQKELRDYLKEIYGTADEYSIQDILERKAVLQSKLDSENSILMTTGLAVIVWLALEAFKLSILYYEDLATLQTFWATVIAAFLAVIACAVVSCFMGRVDTKYRKYNLTDFELRIIDAILEEKFHYQDTITDIVNTRFKQQTAPSNGNKESTPCIEEEPPAIEEAQEDEAKV